METGHQGTVIMAEYSHPDRVQPLHYFKLQVYLLVCKLSSLLPLLLFYPLSHVIRNAHLYGYQLVILIGDEFPLEPMRFPAFAQNC